MNYKEIESFLTSLKSVTSCKIVANENNEIDEIHILSDSSRNSKQISRDIQSVLISRYDIHIDYKKISIAQIDKDMIKNKTSFRLDRKSISYESFDNVVSLKVKLQWHDKTFIGEAEGVKSEINILRLAVKAALKSIEKAIGVESCFIFEDLKVNKLAERDIISVAVSFVPKVNEGMFCGSAFIGSDRMEAAVKATLDAINRRISLYYTG